MQASQAIPPNCDAGRRSPDFYESPTEKPEVRRSRTKRVGDKKTVTLFSAISSSHAFFDITIILIIDRFAALSFSCQMLKCVCTIECHRFQIGQESSRIVPIHCTSGRRVRNLDVPARHLQCEIAAPGD